MLNIKTIAVTTIVAGTVILNGCGESMNQTQKDTLTGAALGAGVGAVGGALVGGKGAAVTGALIGTGVGAVGGSMMSNDNK